MERVKHWIPSSRVYVNKMCTDPLLNISDILSHGKLVVAIQSVYDHWFICCVDLKLGWIKRKHITVTSEDNVYLNKYKKEFEDAKGADNSR